MGMDGVGFELLAVGQLPELRIRELPKLLDLSNRGYPGENEWQLWCQCHNKLGLTCEPLNLIHPWLQY